MADKNRVWMRKKDVDDLGQDSGWCSVYSYEPAPPSRAATLVVHDGEHESVFTESEVRAMVKEMTRDWRVTVRSIPAIKEIAFRNGIVLDPA